METHLPQISLWLEKEQVFPHKTTEPKIVETHISTVFLTGDYAYKIKKAVDFGFLDFTTLKKRKYYCRRELTLNRRLTEDVYLSVETITFDGKRYHWNGPGEVVEYAVKMRQLPDERTFKHLLEEDNVEAGFVDNLAKILSDFYKNAKHSKEIDAFGDIEVVRKNCMENFTQLHPLQEWIPHPRLFKITEFTTRSFLKYHKNLFAKRVKEKKIRDCHGDLRCEHIYDLDRIQILDCIEFNERFRNEDPASDIAFLAMDLDRMGQETVSLELVKKLARDMDDPDLFLLLDFYKCYRAMVQVKIGCFKLPEAGDRERQALASHVESGLKLAYRYAVQFARPLIRVVCGLTATGKSTLAKEMAETFGLPWLRSDVIRKEMFGKRPEEENVMEYGKGMYSEEATSLTYGKMLRMAREELENGRSVILDATFSQKKFREEALRLARDTGVNIVFIECVCNQETIKQRLKEREEEKGVADARLKHLDRMKQSFEPLTELSEDKHLVVDTEKSQKEAFTRVVLSGHEKLSIQTDEAIELP
jgi:hypothetical protein